MDVHQLGWKREDGAAALLTREWLVTNGLGGYASGTIGGLATRRFHGWLIAAMPAPLGRAMMLNHLDESIGGQAFGDAEFLAEFSLDCGVPVWRYRRDGLELEKRIVMPYGQNTTYILYRLLRGGEQALELRPSVNFRHHEGILGAARPHEMGVCGREIEITQEGFEPKLRLLMVGENARLDSDPRALQEIRYALERDRGYEYEGPLWSPGIIRITLRQGVEAGLVVSTESWDVIHALNPHEAIDADQQRRDKMLSKAAAHDAMEAQLILAADQFLIRPTTRSADEARIAAAGDSPRTVIAGYHWFTDWGRDTMISLEGLTLCTGRHREAGSILRTFASYIRDGLIPNMFPEGEHGGLYHTADATMWFFHAVARYVRWTNDRHTLRELLPKMVEIIEHHVKGTHFNIHVDPNDGLLHQGAEGYQLTWMDAKVDDWVVTPRRGKAVEINALYYNALRVLETFLREEGETQTAERMRALAARAFDSFNERFWFADGQYLYDVLDPQDHALRPNQIFAISLDHPVLARERWPRIVDVVEKELLTPVGLRSLGRNHRDYKPKYDGDLRARDAAYHQGTVWGWLIGPFIDAWMKVHGDAKRASRFLDGFRPHLGEACIGTISEIFDAEAPYTPRGCAAQAWSVAEVLRCLTSLRSA